jgi:2-methylcitrate dehydratase PrpD
MGVFGAAAASGILLGLSEGAMTSALGLAGTHASGLWSFHGDASAHKRFHAGKAAHDGRLAAELALAGLDGPARILEDEDGGVFRSMGSDGRIEPVTESWGNGFKIDDVNYKVYASCRSTHAAIESLLTLRRRRALALPQVRRVEIETFRFAKLQCDHPDWPRSPQEVRFNFRYAAAVVLQDGAADTIGSWMT